MMQDMTRHMKSGRKHVMPIYPMMKLMPGADDYYAPESKSGHADHH